MNLAILRWIMRGAVENWRTRSSMLGPGAATVYKALARGACAARGVAGGRVCGQIVRLSEKFSCTP